MTHMTHDESCGQRPEVAHHMTTEWMRSPKVDFSSFRGMLSHMLCPHCTFQQPDEVSECRRCRIIFARYRPTLDACGQSAPVAKPQSSAFMASSHLMVERARQWLCTVDGPISPSAYGGRLLVYFGLLVWGWKFLSMPMETNYVGESYMHLINLPFHEAGHLMFRPMGRFLHVLGGTLGQLLMPLMCTGALLIKNRDAFGAAMGLWWFAESTMDIAPYINDARALDLVLLGGVTGKEVENYHDWEQILGMLGWLPYDHTIAHTVYTAGSLFMMLAFLWAGYMLLLQFKHTK